MEHKDPPDPVKALTPELVLQAYTVGLFPMAESAVTEQIFWCDPPWRGVIRPEAFHIPRRLRRTARQMPFIVTADKAFTQVIDACAGENVESRSKTWINPVIRSLYIDLFTMGYGHSIECWQDGELVGGLYGVALGGAFFGESMFSRARDASKIALVHLMARLWDGGFQLLDTQFMTDHLAQFGAEEIEAQDYKRLLYGAVRRDAFFKADYSVSGTSSDDGDTRSSPSRFSSEEALVSSFLQSRTQIS